MPSTAEIAENSSKLRVAFETTLVATLAAAFDNACAFQFQ